MNKDAPFLFQLHMLWSLHSGTSSSSVNKEQFHMLSLSLVHEELLLLGELVLLGLIIGGHMRKSLGGP